MSASAINAAPSIQPGAAAGNAGMTAAAQGPLAGFEALLATFFGAQGEPVVPGQTAKTATAKTGAAGTLVEGAVDTATDKATDDPKLADADAAAAACNLTFIVPGATLPIADAPAPTPAGAGAGGAEAAKAAPAFGLAKALPKPAAPALAPSAKAVAATEAAETSGAELDPSAQAPHATARLDPSVATKPSAPEPTRPTAPPQTPAPGAPAPAATAAPEIPVDGAASPVAPALAAQQAAVEAGAVEQAAPNAPVAAKDKVQGAKSGRNEHGRVDVATTSLAKPGAAAGAAVAPAADSTPNNAADDHAAQTSIADTKTEAADGPAGSADAGAATASTTTPTTLVHPGAVLVRGSPQTVANLAAQIAKKLEGRSTRFDLQLDPAGLGRVDVRMEIGATGRMTAAMTFDTPAAAAELRSRAAELQRHLEQAGFDMSGGLSFDVAGDRGQGRQAPQNQDNDSGQAFRGRAFQQALATAGEAAQSAASGALNLRRSLLSGVDVRI
jgi:Meckel syndrome type 1 protein